VITLKFESRLLALALVATFVSACGGGGSSSGGSPVGVLPTAQPTTPVTPTSTPTGAVDAAAYVCPSSDTVGSSTVGRGVHTLGDAVGRRAAAGRRRAVAVAGRLEVTYDVAALAAARTAVAAREASLGASLVREFQFSHLRTATRILSVAPAQAAAVAAKLRAQAGVRSVSFGGPRLAPQTVTAPYFTNDPYFTGFPSPLATAAGGTAPPSTYEVAPYEESATVPGQWNLHAIGLEHAFAYSQAGNGSNVTSANALGSAGVKIAVIDTGEDTTHPELHAKITYQKCFLTNPSTNVQSTSSFTTDEDGHGTDVAGIAGAATNNGLGFAGAGGNASIYGYRIQPTPDDNCTSDTTTDDQCLADTADIASAIEDAVARGVNVINISLGGGSCTSGQDPDTVEGSAIADAIAANVVVVAAAGNDGSVGVSAPACDTGVIAAGASALEDGQPTGASTVAGTATAPIEYVASYSDYGSPGAAVKSSSAWGIVAPGGDPSSATDEDDLHWVEDIWTTTPFQSSSTDTSFEGNCAPDYPGTSAVIDCRTLIAGTSMASPTVAGAAALVIAANSSYQSPARMKALLCSTADDIADSKEGCGRLNVYRAMAVALGDTSPP